MALRATLLERRTARKVALLCSFRKSGDFSEQEHPRDEGGKFAESAQAPSVKPSKVGKQSVSERMAADPKKAIAAARSNHVEWTGTTPEELAARVDALSKAPPKDLVRFHRETEAAYLKVEAEKRSYANAGFKERASELQEKLDELGAVMEAAEQALEKGHGMEMNEDGRWVNKRNMVNEDKNVVEKLAFFLHDKLGSVTGKWSGRLTTAEQKEVFGGAFFGKAQIQIDGSKEIVKTKRTVSFGQDADVQTYTWAEIAAWPKNHQPNKKSFSSLSETSGGALVAPAKQGKPVKLRRSALGVKALKPPKLKESYFSSCERDDAGRCVPKGEGGSEASGETKPAELDKSKLPSSPQEAERQALAKAETIFKRFKDAPRKLVNLGMSKASALYAKMESKYGRGWARCVIAVAIITLPTPFTTGAVAATVGMAHLCTKMFGKEINEA